MAEEDEGGKEVFEAEEALNRTTLFCRPSLSSSAPITQDGSGFFVKGLTLPTLSPAVLEQAKERETSSMANNFGFHMSQVKVSSHFYCLFNFFDFFFI